MINLQKCRRPFGLRMPDDLKHWLTSRAEENGRSVNREIIQLLKSEWQREGQCLIGVRSSVAPKSKPRSCDPAD